MIISVRQSDVRGKNHSKGTINQSQNKQMNRYYSNPMNKQVSFGMFPMIDPGAIVEVFRNVIMYTGARAVIDVAKKGVVKLYHYAKGLFGYTVPVGEKATARKAREATEIAESFEDKVATILKRNPQQTQEEVLDILGEKLNRAAIPLKGDGYEQGLNKVIGLSKLKTNFYNDLLSPLCDILDGKPKHHIIPNGINFFGPKGSGKTHFAQQLGEHYAKKGGYYKEVVLTNDSKADIKILDKVFAEAEDNYINSGQKKYTMVFIDEIEKYFMNNNEAQRPTAARLLELSNNCKNKGVILLSTTNYLDKIEPSLLRTGRTDVRVPIGHVADYDLMDMINYYLKKNRLPHELENINFEEIRQTVETEQLQYKPQDIESRLVSEAQNVIDYGGKMTTDVVKDALLKSKPIVNEEERAQFAADKDFAKKLGGIYEF